ncbi:Transposase IS66 family protein [Escherichia coli]|nr:Transposase IS66 family protein [Escherichia coli]
MSEQLELISSSFKVIETQRPKLACCRCDHIVQAPVPSKPIARSYAGAGLLAHVVTGKYADHLPLYRQSEIYRRQGVELSRATLGRWCVFRSIRSRIGIEVRSAIRIHSINRELNFFYRFLTRFFAAFHCRGIFPQGLSLKDHSV